MNRHLIYKTPQHMTTSAFLSSKFGLVQTTYLVTMGPYETTVADSFILRMHRPGDMGFITHRHAIQYTEQYRWNEQFEAFVSRITADFIENYDPAKERCWIADSNGEFLGCVMLVQSEQRSMIAKLRLLLVEPTARGLGLGTRLLQKCVQFAREAGYQRIVLWTYSILLPARRLYERAGFQIIQQEECKNFGHILTSETWELILSTNDVS